MDLGSSRTTNILAALALAFVFMTFYADRKLDALWPFPLVYETEGIVCKATVCSLNVWIKNNGWAVQRDVRFEIPELTKKNLSMYVSRAYTFVPNASTKTLDLGNIPPGAFRFVGLHYPKDLGDQPDFARGSMSIYSSDSNAFYNGPGDESIAMPLWWWYSLYGMFAFILLAILGRLFERPKSRYTRLLQELDQSLKARELADRKVINIRQQIDSIPPEAINAAESEYNKWPIWLIPKSRRGMVDTAEGPKTAPAEPPTVSGVDTAPTAPEKAPIRA